MVDLFAAPTRWEIEKRRWHDWCYYDPPLHWYFRIWNWGIRVDEFYKWAIGWNTCAAFISFHFIFITVWISRRGIHRFFFNNIPSISYYFFKQKFHDTKFVYYIPGYKIV